MAKPIIKKKQANNRMFSAKEGCWSLVFIVMNPGTLQPVRTIIKTNKKQNNIKQEVAIV
jgi:Zn/Cd-binding protein ZinT